MWLYTVYYSTESGWASYLPTQDPLEAEAWRAEVSKEGRATRIEKKWYEPTKYIPPVCQKCGTPKVCDLFKGEYCPRCNDWC